MGKATPVRQLTSSVDTGHHLEHGPTSDIHKHRRWKANKSQTVTYVTYIPIMFAYHDEQVKLICILTFHKRYIIFISSDNLKKII